MNNEEMKNIITEENIQEIAIELTCCASQQDKGDFQSSIEKEVQLDVLYNWNMVGYVRSMIPEIVSETETYLSGSVGEYVNDAIMKIIKKESDEKFLSRYPDSKGRGGVWVTPGQEKLDEMIQRILNQIDVKRNLG